MRGRRLTAAGRFSSAGTAQATEPTYFYNSDNSMQVSYGEGGGAIFATITDLRNPPGAIEVCQYHAVGVQGTPALPYNRPDDAQRAESLPTDHDHLPATRRTLRRRRELPGHGQFGGLLAGHLLIQELRHELAKVATQRLTRR